MSAARSSCGGSGYGGDELEESGLAVDCKLTTCLGHTTSGKTMRTTKRNSKQACRQIYICKTICFKDLYKFVVLIYRVKFLPHWRNVLQEPKGYPYQKVLAQPEDRDSRRPRCWFGGVASTSVACVVAPFDLVKTHMQTQNRKKGMIATARKVVQLRGLIGFYDGFSAAAMRQMCVTSLRFSLYEVGKDLELMQNGLMVKVFLASVAGILGSVVAIPLDVINIRMQTDMKNADHEGRKYRCLSDALIRIPREEGWRALYNGGYAAVLKAAIGTIGQIAVYDQVKSELLSRSSLNDDVKLHFTSSVISAIIDSIITQPFDVLKTLMMNARPGQFPSMLSAVKFMMRFGFLGPYRGLAPTLVRKVPATIMMYIIYEQLRLKLGILDINE
ncbi:mitochondrial dicarboxylate carrier-like [Drosophila innubila]|uniref:mitochondrial dicarboxylate carrier-like n=1 Tax=Drosophila innubila TaxID=198719 RepID=UPI00148B3E1F|nr:mitochondrial dicarboxylate carrier-like [Drosophila innubila]